MELGGDFYNVLITLVFVLDPHRADNECCWIRGSKSLHALTYDDSSLHFQLAREFGTALGDPDKAGWLLSITAILTCVLGPPVAQAADYWGRKWFIVSLTTLGFVGCIIIARATSMNMAIGGQVVASFALGSQPLLYAVVSEILPRRWRPEAQAGLNVALAIGALVGVLVGVKITATNPDNFRTYYYITAGCNGIAAVICAVLYNPLPRPLQSQLTFREKLAKVRSNTNSFNKPK